MYPAHHENQLLGIFFILAMCLWQHSYLLLYYMVSSWDYWDYWDYWDRHFFH